MLTRILFKTFIYQILRFWKDDIFDQVTLEALLESHLDFLACPIALLVLRFVALIQHKVGEDSFTKWRIFKRGRC